MGQWVTMQLVCISRQPSKSRLFFANLNKEIFSLKTSELLPNVSSEWLTKRVIRWQIEIPRCVPHFDHSNNYQINFTELERRTVAATPWPATIKVSSTTGNLTSHLIPSEVKLKLPVLQPPREWSCHGLEHDLGIILPQQGCAISRQHAIAVDQPALCWWWVSLDSVKQVWSFQCDSLEVCDLLISNISGFTSSRGPSFKKTRLTFEYSACVSKMAVPRATWTSTCQKPQYSKSIIFSSLWRYYQYSFHGQMVTKYR